jgi:hypothetical protein
MPEQFPGTARPAAVMLGPANASLKGALFDCLSSVVRWQRKAGDVDEIGFDTRLLRDFSRDARPKLASRFVSRNIPEARS